MICTQPRALAAMTIAQRIASEFDNSSVGENVGYKTGRDKTIKGRRIELMTDACLVRLAQKDLSLKGVSVLIIDEAHERSLNTDLVIGISKLVLQQRPNDFYVVISSATIDPKPFLEFYFETDPLPKSLSVKGRVFDITDEEKPIEFTGSYDFLVPNVLKILKENPLGNCLVFLPGTRDVDNAVKCFKKSTKDEENWVCLPLYGSLPPEDQARVMSFKNENDSMRMVVFCTNIAETSLTVPNVRIVIDTGLANEARYDPKRRITVLEQVYISRSSSMQRRGRAGRTAEGLCVRFYELNSLKRNNVEPEILRSSLDLVVLQLKTLKFDPITFPFMTRPKEEYLLNSVQLLKDFACLEGQMNEITKKGKLFVDLLFDPRMSNFLVTAHEKYGESENCAVIAAILTAPVRNLIKVNYNFYRDLSSSWVVIWRMGRKKKIRSWKLPPITIVIWGCFWRLLINGPFQGKSPITNAIHARKSLTKS